MHIPHLSLHHLILQYPLSPLLNPYLMPTFSTSNISRQTRHSIIFDIHQIHHHTPHLRPIFDTTSSIIILPSVGQGVVKACSGKLHPIFQFFNFDSVETLPTKASGFSDFQPLNSRYDAHILMFESKLSARAIFEI